MKQLWKKKIVFDLVDYRNSPMDLTDVGDRTSGDLSVLKAGLLPQVRFCELQEH